MRYWVKLYTEIVNDPKMGRLTDRQFRTCINLFALAGEIDRRGELPGLDDLAWRLRMQPADLTADLEALAAVGIVVAASDTWIVAKWQERQSKAPSAAREKVLQRVHEYRERERNEDVTTLHPEVKRDVTPPEKNRIEKNREDTEKSVVTVPPQPKPKGKAPAPAPKIHDTKLDHPAVIAYRDATHLTPNETQRQAIVERVTDTERWSRIVREWLVAGWKPSNVQGMLDRYSEPARSNGRQPAGKPNYVLAIEELQAEEAAAYGNIN